MTEVRLENRESGIRFLRSFVEYVRVLGFGCGVGKGVRGCFVEFCLFF